METSPTSDGAISPIILTPADQVMITVMSLRGGTGQPKTAVYQPTWKKNAGSKYQTSQVVNQNVITSSFQNDSPNTGFLIIEIFYDYYQLLNMPIFSSIVPNPIPVYTYAIMPLSAAEPTPVVQAKPSPIAQ